MELKELGLFVTLSGSGNVSCCETAGDHQLNISVRSSNTTSRQNPSTLKKKMRSMAYISQSAQVQ